MFRSTRTLAALVIGFAGLVSTSSAKAQYPPMDMSAIYNMNANFDRQFYAALPEIARRTAIATRGQQLPFNAMTISASTTALSNQYAANNANWYNNQAIQSRAVGNWTTGAIQNNWAYTNGSQTYVMPYTTNAYNMQNGYMYNGYQYGGNNFRPVYYGR